MSNPYVPNSAPIPNIMFDYWMAQLSPAEFKVLMAIARKTYGWHKTRDRISLRQLTELTGLHKSGVIKSTENLVELGIVNKIKSKDPFDGSDSPNQYEINVDCLVPRVEKNTGGSLPSRQGGVDTVDTPGVDTVDTQKTLYTKDTIQKDRKVAPSIPSPLVQKKTKKQEPNVPFGEYVKLREGEYEKLSEDMGKELVNYYIQAINNHIPNSKPYKDYAAAIRQWYLRAKADGKLPNVKKVNELTPVTSSPDRNAKNKQLADFAEKKLNSMFTGRVYFQAGVEKILLVHSDKDIKKEIEYESYDTPKFKEVLLRELESFFPNARAILTGKSSGNVNSLINDLALKFKTKEAS